MKNTIKSQSKNKQVVLITGGSSGIGRLTAQTLAAQGYRVFATSRYPDKCTPIAGVEFVQLDICEQASIDRCIKEVFTNTEHIDVLINNAGYMLSGSIEETSADEMRLQFETNFFGLVNLSKVVITKMRERKAGKIINISSLLGFASVPFVGIYSASKFAVEGYTEALYHELIPFSVQVAMLEPGVIKTKLFAHGKSVSSPIGDYNAWKDQVLAALEVKKVKGTEAQAVANKLVSMIESDDGALRVTVGSDAGLVKWLKRWMPSKIFQKIWRNEFGLNKV